MGGKVVVSVISVILVVGVVIGVVAVVYSGRNNVSNKNEQEKVSASMKAVHTLCGPATFKDACLKTLGEVAAQNQSATPQDIVKSGAKLALQELFKALNFSDTLTPQANATKNPARTQDAIKACKEQLDSAVDRLNEVVQYAANPEASYKNKFLVWDMRLSLSDAYNFATDCMDEFEEAQAPELAKIIQDAVAVGANLTVSILDIVTVFNQALGEMQLDTTKLDEMAASWIPPAFVAVSDHKNALANRRLLGMVDEDGYPSWLSAADRQLLSTDNVKNERKLANIQKAKKVKKPKGNKAMKKKKKKVANAAGAAMGGAAAVGGAAAISMAPPVAAGARPPPNAVVAKDGSGQYRTIMDAVRAHPGKNLQGRWVIYVKAGVYTEDVLLEKQHINIMMYGDGPTATVVTGHKNTAIMNVQTVHTAPFQVEAAGFFCKDMGFQNTAGPDGEQAVAFRTKGKYGVLQNCWFDGYQDTLYVQAGSQFFRDCQISGSIDFIFGDGATLIQNSNIIVRKGKPNQKLMITAEGGKAPNENTGIVIHGCKILPDKDLVPVKFQHETYLGRPWKPYCRTVFMETEMADIIRPEGYHLWDGTNHHLTAFYGEYRNYGPGANTAARVKWPNVKVLNKPEAQRWMPGAFLEGGLWIKDAGVAVNFDVQ